MNLSEFIKNKRPSLSAQSIKTYKSILSNLYKNVFGDGEIDYKNFDDTKKIISFLKTVEPRKRKTILSALVVITDDKDYRTLMLEDIKDYNTEEGKQEQSDKQKENWVGGDEVKDILHTLEQNAKVLYKKKNLSPQDLQEIQNYIILCLLGGSYIAPRRSKDYVDFKIRDIDKSKDNYFIGKRLIFNSYKTAKTYGQQELVLPSELSKILKKWIAVNPTNYLLFDTAFNQLTNVKLNQRLNKIFDYKKVGVNQLRHTYLSDKYQSTIKANQDMLKDMQNMGSSKSQEKIYIKKNTYDI